MLLCSEYLTIQIIFLQGNFVWYVNYLLAYFLIHAANALKTALKILYCIPDDFKELVTINFTGSLCKTLSWIRSIPICKIGYKLIVVVWKHDFMYLFGVIFIHINWLWLAKDWYCNDSLLALGFICSLFIKQENIHSQYRTQHEQYRGTDRIRMVKQFQDRGRRRTYVVMNMQRVRAGGNPRESGRYPRRRSERQAAIYQETLN